MLTAYNKALEDALAVLEKIALPIDVNDRKRVPLPTIMQLVLNSTLVVIQYARFIFHCRCYYAGDGE